MPAVPPDPSGPAEPSGAPQPADPGVPAATGPAPAHAPGGSMHVVELRKEAATMALYVAISLLAALTALPEGTREHIPMIGLIWGTTAGLAIAHVFAFRVTSRLVATGRVGASDALSGAAQVAGAAVVALAASVAVGLSPEPVEGEVLGLVLAATIALVGFAVAVGGGATRRRALVYAGGVLVVAIGVVQLKNQLTGH